MIVSEYNFLNDNEEIYFFKEIKPKLFSKLIYFRKIYYLELNRPVADFNRIRKYLHKEQYRIHFFSERNADFIQYYRSGKTTLDKFYFLRNRREFELNLECFYFERDPKFSTNFDFKVAKLLANDMLAAYLNAELANPWTDRQTGEIINTFSIITTDANPMMEVIHNSKKRMPLILSRDDIKRWNDLTTEIDDVNNLMKPYPESKMNAYQVSKDAGNSRINRNHMGIKKRIENTFLF